MHVPTKFESEATENLIQMTFYYHGHPITALILALKSMLSIQPSLQNEFPCQWIHAAPLLWVMPMEERVSSGLINGVHLLTCGAVKTVCDIFVGDTVPFDLLLGWP